MNWRNLQTVEEVRAAFERGDEVQWKILGGNWIQPRYARNDVEWYLSSGQFRARTAIAPFQEPTT